MRQCVFPTLAVVALILLPLRAGADQGLTNSIGMKFVRIEAGSFTMGGELDADQVVKAFGGQADWYKTERPQHRVKISKAFMLGATHVTRAQFAAFVHDTQYVTDAQKQGKGWTLTNDGYREVAGVTWQSPGIDQTDAHPVVMVSWNDAMAFCVWLSAKEGRHYHLPTEAQWEYACRAGTQTIFPWGNDVDALKGHANIADQATQQMMWRPHSNFHFDVVVPWNDGFGATSPVGSFKPNAWGLYDMIGNAFQWCSDRLGGYATGDVTDPTGPAAGEKRVSRGSSWDCFPQRARAAFRGGGLPTGHSAFAGFRCEMDVP